MRMMPDRAHGRRRVERAQGETEPEPEPKATPRRAAAHRRKRGGLSEVERRLPLARRRRKLRMFVKHVEAQAVVHVGMRSVTAHGRHAGSGAICGMPVVVQVEEGEVVGIVHARERGGREGGAPQVIVCAQQERVGYSGDAG